MTRLVSQPEMTAEDVWDFLNLMVGHGIHIWLDGGRLVMAKRGAIG